MTTTENLITETATDVVRLTGNTAADHPAGVQIAEGADTGHGETEHADPVTETSASAGTGAGEGRAHQLVWLDPATLRVHPRNVRDDLGDLSGLIASIAATGVIEALTVVPDTDADGVAGHMIVAGHRRAAAAVMAGQPVVPCVLRPDQAAEVDDRAGQAQHVGAMLAENTHRAGLTAVEEARGVQSMLDLGMSLTKVAKTTGLGRRRVAKAAGVARLTSETAAAVTAADLTLDQAAAVAVYADDEATTDALIAAAGEGPGRFAHALTRAKQARAEAEAIAALAAELVAAGRTVLDPDAGRAATGLHRLDHDGQPLTAEIHTGCTGSAAYVVHDWQGVRAVEVCTDPAGNGHTDRWSTSTLPGGTGELSEADREQAKAERRATIEGNKAMSAANETRREFVRALLTRRTSPRGALRFCVETMATDPRAVSRWLSGQPNAAQDAAAADLGLIAPGQWWGGREKPAATLTSGEQVADPRLPVALLAHVAAACECGIDRQSWRNPNASHARWLRFLVECGYTLSDVEQGICDAVTEHTVGIALDVEETDTPDEQS